MPDRAEYVNLAEGQARASTYLSRDNLAGPPSLILVAISVQKNNNLQHALNLAIKLIVT